jgi:predicted P-loop ATPase
VGTINDDKDSKLQLASKLLINLDELGSLNREEIGYLKSLYSLTHITIREPYMRKSRALVRRASFVGSIDREEFLTDLSGTRRFLTFAVSDVDYQHTVDMDKVYAQAFALYKKGERFYFDEAEIKVVNTNNEDFRLKPLEEDLFFRYFEKPTNPAQTVLLTTTEIARDFAELDNSYKVTDASIRKLGQLLSKNEFTKKNKKTGGTSVKAWAVQRANRMFSVAAQPAQPMFQVN